MGIEIMMERNLQLLNTKDWQEVKVLQTQPSKSKQTQPSLSGSRSGGGRRK